MNDYLRSVGGGFAGALRFRGRDRRARFWPYAIFVFGLGQIVGMAAMTPALLRFQLEMLQRSGRLPGDGGPYGEMQAMIPFLSDTMRLGALIGAVTVALLAAAVVRRLHDCDRTGAWGLLPLPFPGAAAILANRAVVGVASSSRPDMSAFAGLFANNLVYMAALGWLIYLLVGEGTPGSNRFGPPPQ
ncbi:MAG TPA: DUF805 domain-containing protein [Allosphingosinicella sp.]|jgi:uncharacterized membrane protein YhaH (DUF805 family)